MFSACLAVALLIPTQTVRPETAEKVLAILAPSQLTLQMDLPGEEIRGRATIVRRSDQTIHAVTAGHVVKEEHVGRTLELIQGDQRASATILALHLNPYYRPTDRFALPGSDNALVVLRVESNEEPARAFLQALKALPVVEWPVPAKLGQQVEISSVDQFGKLHIVRAGNFENPRWLEWGPSYRPIPGDSGSGAFMVRRTSEGGFQAQLIAVVTNNSPTGGGASLVFARLDWLARALEAPVKLKAASSTLPAIPASP